MIVAFWSNVRGKGSVTSNLACIGIISAMENKRCILLENHFNIHGMECILKEQKSPDYFKEDYSYQTAGIEPFMRQLHSGFPVRDIGARYGVSYLDGRLVYLPQNGWSNQELFDFEFCQVLKPMLKGLSRECDGVFIDTGSQDLGSTKAILEAADIIAVNLNQSPFLLEHYFSNYHSYMEKSIFLLGHYERESKFNLKTILKNYPVSKDYIGIIPYYPPFAEAMGEGRLLKFFSENQSLEKKDKGYYFFEKAKEAAQCIWKRGGDRHEHGPGA